MIELPHTPPPLHLSPRAIELLTALCFRHNDEAMDKPGAFFIFGTSLSIHELAKSLQGLMREKAPPLVIITGGIEVEPGLKESEAIFSAIRDLIPQEAALILEKASQNTYENVAFGLAKIDHPLNSLCFVAKSYHAGRAYLTLRHSLPKTTIYQASYPARDLSSEYPILACNWPCKPEFIERVWGEYLRIKTYAQRGHLSVDEVLECLAELEAELSQ